jgi:methylmalonyl-CoA epimerase
MDRLQPPDEARRAMISANTILSAARIDHIGIAVHSIDAALETYRGLLGIGTAHIVELPERNVRIAMVAFGGCYLEFVEPTGPGSPLIARLQERGEGIYHLALAVAKIDVALDALRHNGATLIDQVPRSGPTGRIAFVSPQSAHGVMLELVERSGQEG